MLLATWPPAPQLPPELPLLLPPQCDAELVDEHLRDGAAGARDAELVDEHVRDGAEGAQYAELVDERVRDGDAGARRRCRRARR